MKRADLFRQIRGEIRAYRRARPVRYTRDLSLWLLGMRGMHNRALLASNWEWFETLEAYFARLLGEAAMCMEEYGVVAPGISPPVERATKIEDSTIDLVFLAIDRGCQHQFPGSARDYAVRIDTCLRRAFDAQSKPTGYLEVLDAVRDIASLATLGLEIKNTTGDCNAKAN